ncbi:exonuclease domain-containing protein [Neptuniibacter sp. QD37_11]|uniref:exonuclease domain-containing protein n=1 Tax=Neptuniibacter sp. QD37_11 TaxID=3398209 RepID=UPI0039F4F124
MKVYLVSDFEMTCCAHGEFDPTTESEIIEWATVAVREDGCILGEFHAFVKPVLHPILTKFCKKLTKIEQGWVDNAPQFSEVFLEFESWVRNVAVDRPRELVTVGNGDIKQLRLEAGRSLQAFSVLNLDPSTPDFINLKVAYPKAKGVNPRKLRLGLKGMLMQEGLEMDGEHHRALWDARNTAKLLPACGLTKSLWKR